MRRGRFALRRVRCIRAHGTWSAATGAAATTGITVEDFDYWLTHGGTGGWIVNRKPTAEAGWDAEPPPTRYRARLIWHDFERELITREQAEELLRGL